ncbi:MAG: hypothetical protein ABMB14_39635 [Myxococcota bacterium]
MTEDQFKDALEAHRTRHTNVWSLEAQADLQQLHLARATALEGLPDAEALLHFRVAEDIEWRIGSESTSAGEGTASMGKLYEIRARRARLAERLGDLPQALDLWESIAADPNGLGKFAAPEIARLKG